MSATLPTGVVTLLFTDVEGSTKLLHELGDAYADALHEHRRLLRDAPVAPSDGNGADRPRATSDSNDQDFGKLY